MADIEKVTSSPYTGIVAEQGLIAIRYLPDGSTEIADNYVTEHEIAAMGICLSLGELALLDGNPPIGAALIDSAGQQIWGAGTVDKASPTLLGHAEVRVYLEAEASVGIDLHDYTLVTTAQPCNTCTAPYAEGKVGRIVYAASRDSIRAVSGLMRERTINMPDLLRDGNTNTTVIEGLRATEALSMFALWADLRDQGDLNG